MRKPVLRCGRTPLETLSRAGLVLIPKRPQSAPARTSTPFPMPGNMTAWSESWEDLRRYERCRRSGFRPKHSIELLVFTSEEPTRFGIGCLGSRLLSGSLSPDAAKKLKDGDGESIDEVRRKAGMRGELEEVKLPQRLLQGIRRVAHRTRSVLERQQMPLGVVTNIAAPASLRVSSKARADMRAES